MKKSLFLFSLFLFTSPIVQGMGLYWGDPRLAFLMAGHPRLGTKSPAGVLPAELLRYIVELATENAIIINNTDEEIATGLFNEPETEESRNPYTTRIYEPDISFTALGLHVIKPGQYDTVRSETPENRFLFIASYDMATNPLIKYQTQGFGNFIIVKDPLLNVAIQQRMRIYNRLDRDLNLRTSLVGSKGKALVESKGKAKEEVRRIFFQGTIAANNYADVDILLPVSKNAAQFYIKDATGTIRIRMTTAPNLGWKLSLLPLGTPKSIEIRQENGKIVLRPL